MTFKNELNNYYANVGKNISDDIHKNNFVKLNWNDMNKNCHINNSIFLEQIDPFEISVIKENTR